MPGGAAGVGGEVAGVPAGADGKSVGERVGVGMRQRRAGNTGGLKQILRDIVLIGVDGDEVPELILERRRERGVGRDDAIHHREQDAAEAEVHVLVGVHAEVGVGDSGGDLRLHDAVRRCRTRSTRKPEVWVINWANVILSMFGPLAQ